MRFRHAQIWLFAILSVVLTGAGAGLITDLVSPSSSASAARERPVEGQPVRKVAAVDGAEDFPFPAGKPPTPVWPGAGVADVTIGAGAAKVPGQPVTVAQASGTGSPGKVRVETLSADAAKRLGGVAVGVRVTRADGAHTPGRVRVGLDYSGFAAALPASAASRLGLIEMPACVLEARPDTVCAKSAAKARFVPSDNDAASRHLVAEVDASAATPSSQGTVYVMATMAAAEDPGAGTGNFAATDLKAAGSWQVGLSGGGFSYTYPIPVPPPVAGEAPKLALSYSSSAIDGLTNYTNNQASVAGMGWDVPTGYVERRFRPCSDDTAETTKNPDQVNWKHQCWESPDENDGDSATTDHTTSYLVLSVDGKSSAIVKDRSSGTWKTVEDYGWKVAYVLDVASGLSSWVVTTTDGTTYRFGAQRDSNWQTAYVGDDTGEPCHSSYSKTGTPGLCNATWRWNLDQETDPHGNVVDYTYTREENWYCKTVGALCQPGPLGDGRAFRVAYDRGGYLAQVEYGRNTNVAGSAHTARVTFNAVDRGTPPVSGMPWDNDTPTDLNCPSGPADVIQPCDTPGPAFYISKRLNTIVTSVHNPATSQWDQVYRLEAGYKWVYTQILQGLPPAGPVLWLDTLRPVGLAGDGPDIPLPPVDFEATLLDNRADYDEAQGKARLRMPRISAVYNGLGGRTDVYYGQANPCPYPSGYPSTGWDTNARDCYRATLGTYYDSSGIPRTSRAVYMKWLVTQTVEKDLVGGSPDMPTRYEYLGTPAWARAFDYMKATTLNGLVCTPPVTGYCKTLSEDWDEFRGYQTVRTIKGAGASPDDYSVTTTAFFRGMYDDPNASGSAKGTRVTDFDGVAYNDLRVLAGRILQEQTWRATTIGNGAAPSVAQGRPAAGPPVPAQRHGSPPRPGLATAGTRPVAALHGAKVIGAALAPARALLSGLSGTATSACTYPTWSRTSFYGKGNRVTWVSHHWEAKNLNMGIGAEPGVDSSWLDLGACATSTPTPTPTRTPTPTPTATPTTPPGGPVLGGYAEVRSTRYEYAIQLAGNGPGIHDPSLVTTSRQVSREAVTSGFRYADQRTAYDSYGLPTKVNDYGDTADAADNTCTTFTYARNTAKWLLHYPATVERRAGDACTSGTLLARTVTLYDGATSPSANTPTRGDATETRTSVSDTEFATVRATYDRYGRPASTTDARGMTTTTAYKPQTGYPVEGITVTNPKGHTGTNWPAPATGQNVRMRDSDGNEVTLEYDALGRTQRLWTPERPQSGGTPAAYVNYTIPYDGTLGQPTSAAKTTINTLRSGSGSTAKWVSTHTYVDGTGRPRETQAASPAGGRIIKAIAYDARGLTAATSGAAYASGAPGSGLLNPVLTSLPQWTKLIYDGVGRTVAEIEYGASAELRRNITRYFGDRLEVQPPVGGKSVFHKDIRDQTTKIEEWADASTHHDTKYTYDTSGHVTTMVDANGNRRTFTYDLQGHRTSAHDPDAGDSQQHFDAAGLLAWTVDGNGQKVSYSYDDLGRKTAAWSGDAGTGVKLVEWVYDTLAKGKLTSSTRFVNDHAYVDRITGYDAMGRPTGSVLTIPSSEGLLAGDYQFTAGYDASGKLSEVGMPAAGGLPAEKITSTFTDLGLAYGLTSDLGGGFTYVKATQYTPTGRLAERSYGAAGKIKRALTWNDSTGWLTRVVTTAKADTSTPQVAQDDRYYYDTAGQITRVLDAASAVPGGTPGQSECFSYDGLQRLSEAWTTTATSCADGVAGADGQGIDPYKQQYAYDAVGNITTFTDNGRASAYRYPAPGATAVRPNAVNSIDRPGGVSDSYTYDDAGRLTARTVAGKAGSFQWDELGKLTKATIDGKDTTMVYDAEGERLIRRDPDGRVTLFLGSMELELANGQLTGKRYYAAPDGSTVAMRSGASGLTWLASGLQGSQQLAVDDTTGQVSRERYLPYGERRGVDDLPFTDRGFLGKIEDGSTGLDYLSARYYDPAIARFVSTDPLLDMSRPQWTNPYSYAGGNPVGLSDPNGLIPCTNQAECDSYKDHLCKKEASVWCKEYLKQKKLAKRAIQEAERWRQAVANLLVARTHCSDYLCIGRIDQQLEQLLGFDPFEYYDDSVAGNVARFTAGVVKFMLEDAVKCTEGSVGSCALFAASFIPGEKLAVAGLKLASKTGKAGQKLGGYLGKAIKSCSSFVPGVKVLMADGGHKPIESVEVGDRVLAYDPETGRTEAKRVEALLTDLGDKDVVTITVASGVVVATDRHPFWVGDQGHWFNASALRPGMRLRSPGGADLLITGVERGHRPGQRVHNLEIEGFHTYYVSVGSADVLVHNANASSEPDCGDAADKAIEEAVSFNKIKEKRLEKELEEKYGIDPHELKQDELGRGAQISRFDVYRGSDGYYWLIRKDGKAKIRTSFKWDR
ncbi:RHS repeat-associated core domain-containing protein [Sphaerisporangium sp. B11E5]|uniref:RHS repeat-associated core domain-containing protein n=1 Tax=Sphaerisporangium sp. B11E5 TaxID=3153563 RepID=UPI00325C3A12